jgi:pimeloyl-ACP methyl ester carboxylesterase
MHETVGRLAREDGHQVAWRRVEGRGPTVLWLGGFRSDMTGTKAGSLAGHAAERGWEFLRFDYLGHGASSGRFQEGTIGRWRADALAVLDELTTGPVVLAGSSMGGWIACLAALARPERVKAMVLIAPAADLTETLMEPELGPAARDDMARKGFWIRPSAYDPEGYPITAGLLQDGRRWNILGDRVAIACPVRTFQGEADADVPWRHALRLHEALESEDAVFTLIRDADHSLSRPQDLARIASAIEELRR